MPNKPGNDDRSFGAPDRERQRDVANETGRTAAASKTSHADGISAASNGTTSRRSNRGFASMDRGKQKEIASKGGKAAHAKGTAHEFDSGEARMRVARADWPSARTANTWPRLVAVVAKPVERREAAASAFPTRAAHRRMAAGFRTPAMEHRP